MAKRKEIILQEILNTQEVWEDAMGKGKLYVVDAHQKWCGPCTAITGMLKRIKNELGDDLLRFATAEVDSVDSLEQYRGKCEPNFLFFASGELVAAIRGCNAPLIQETINSSLEAEHKVLNGEAERKVIRDVCSETPEGEPDEESDEEDSEEGVVPKQVTMAVIKPDVVQNEQVDEIIAKIEEAGIEILANDERMLTEDEAKEFYKNKAEESYFDDLIKYVTSGPCRVLILTKGETGEGVVELWRDIIGPFDAAVAKEENPDSLRAIYGTDATSNALHGSSSSEEAIRELAFFYPQFRPPTVRNVKSATSRTSTRHSKRSTGKSRLQRTLAIIRPDALRTHKDAILQKIEEAGFEIAMQKEILLSKEQAESFYAEHKDKEFFEPLVKQMTCGPVLALCLAHKDAVERWRQMLGPKIVSEAQEQAPDSLRAQFHGEDSDVNLLHGSDSENVAESELSQIFDIEQTLAVIKPDAMSDKEQIMEKIKEAGFMISCQKDMSLTKDIAGEIYKSKEGTDFYDDLVNHMTSGETLMMVLSAENAVEKLRSIMGPADPEVAKDTHPLSLRALFAKSILQNAIHAPSNQESAHEKIKIVFGDIEFKWDGMVLTKSDESAAEGDKVDEDKVDEDKADEDEQVEGEDVVKETQEDVEANQDEAARDEAAHPTEAGSADPAEADATGSAETDEASPAEADEASPAEADTAVVAEADTVGPVEVGEAQANEEEPVADTNEAGLGEQTETGTADPADANLEMPVESGKKFSDRDSELDEEKGRTIEVMGNDVVINEGITQEEVNGDNNPSAAKSITSTPSPQMRNSDSPRPRSGSSSSSSSSSSSDSNTSHKNKD